MPAARQNRPPGPTCACDQPAVCAAVGVELGSRSRLLNAAAKGGGILRFLQTSLTSCSAERGRRAVAAIAYEGSLTIAQPLQPRPALMGRGVSGRTECRPRTPKPLLAKLLLPKLLPPKLLLPMCFPACAFFRVAQVSCD